MGETPNQDLFADWGAMRDPVSGLVAAAGLRGIVLSSFELGEPWNVGARPELGPVLHFIRGGPAFLDTPDAAEPCELGDGDVVLLPRGGPYVLSDSYPSTLPTLVPAPPVGGPVRCSVRVGGDGARSQLICCAYRFMQAVVAAPLLSFLPRLIVVRHGSASKMIRATLLELIDELGSEKAGSDGIVSRLAELVFMRVLREHLERGSSADADLLTALLDPQIGRALQQIHEAMATPWTVASLAASVGMSRAAFAEMFARQAGVSPMRYLQKYRMQEGARLVATTQRTFGEIGQAVGYSDAAAFSRAFRRETGCSPREYRHAAALRE